MILNQMLGQRNAPTNLKMKRETYSPSLLDLLFIASFLLFLILKIFVPIAISHLTEISEDYFGIAFTKITKKFTAFLIENQCICIDFLLKI